MIPEEGDQMQKEGFQYEDRAEERRRKIAETVEGHRANRDYKKRDT